MKKLSFIIIVLFFASIISAQSNDSLYYKNHEIGLNLGSTTGIGLSYRYWPNKLGLQLSLLPVKTSETVFINIGVTGLYSFYNTKKFTFFSYFGNSFIYNRYKEYNYNMDTNGQYIEDTKSVDKLMYNIGLGPGVRFGLDSRLSIYIMAGYGMYDVFDEFNILPAGEIGIYLRL